METKKLFYSLYEITLTKEVIESTSTCLEKSFEDSTEESMILTFHYFIHLQCQRSSYKDGDKNNWSRFLWTFALFYYSKLRIYEIAHLAPTDIKQLCETKILRLYQSKVNDL